jgi:hypothetical protein
MTEKGFRFTVDIFFVFAFSVQFVVLVLKQNDIERWLTIAAAPVTIAILAAGFLSVKREIRWLMGCFMGGCVLGMAYFGFKVRVEPSIANCVKALGGTALPHLPKHRRPIWASQEVFDHFL